MTGLYKGPWYLCLVQGLVWVDVGGCGWTWLDVGVEVCMYVVWMWVGGECGLSTSRAIFSRAFRCFGHLNGCRSRPVAQNEPAGGTQVVSLFHLPGASHFGYSHSHSHFSTHWFHSVALVPMLLFEPQPLDPMPEDPFGASFCWWVPSQRRQKTLPVFVDLFCASFPWDSLGSLGG